jgi:hypothetical protein
MTKSLQKSLLTSLAILGTTLVFTRGAVPKKHQQPLIERKILASVRIQQEQVESLLKQGQQGNNRTTLCCQLSLKMLNSHETPKRELAKRTKSRR